MVSTFLGILKYSTVLASAKALGGTIQWSLFISTKLLESKFFGSTNKCLKEKDELFEHLLEYLDTSIDRIVRMPFQLPSNSKNDKTYLTTDFFFYENRNEISITCQRSEIEPRVGFTVSFFSKELRGF